MYTNDATRVNINRKTLDRLTSKNFRSKPVKQSDQSQRCSNKPDKSFPVLRAVFLRMLKIANTEIYQSESNNTLQQRS